MPLVTLWFQAFVWTLILEAVVVAWFLRGEAITRRGTLVLFANLITHPAVWFVFPELGVHYQLPHVVTLVASELWAYGLEAWFYCTWLGQGRIRDGIWLAVVANTVSLVAGFALRAVGWV